MTYEKQFLEYYYKNKTKEYDLCLQTDIYANYFITSVEDNIDDCMKYNIQHNIEYLKEEIEEVGYSNLFSLIDSDFEFSPCKHYKCKFKVFVDTDKCGEILDIYPLITKIEEF